MPANANLINVLLMLAVMFVGYLFVLIPILIYYAIQHMRSPQLILMPEEEACDYYTGKCGSESEWARSRQFREAGVYRWQQNFILVWEHVESATYFQVTLSPYGRFHNFTTLFVDDYSLLTANDRESLIFPAPPRRFVQSFGIEQIEPLYEKHSSAVEDLIRIKHLEPSHEFPEFEESYLASMQRQHEHVRSVMFYPVRGIWWYHIDRRSRFNRPIDLQQAVLDN